MFINPYKIIVVKGDSMKPTYKSGDILLGSKDRNFKRGDVVVLKNDFQETIIKRITFLPGETYYSVFFVADGVTESDIISKEQYENFKKSKSNYTILLKDKVPLNQFFVTGDNRRNSDDSRRFGSISEETILYKVIK